MAMNRTHVGLVPRTRSSRTPRGKCGRELRVQRGARIIELLVAPRFRSSYLNVRQVLTNFGIGPLVCAVALMIGASAAQAQGTVKIGLINVLSGQFADAGIQLDNGVKTYMKQHGDTVAGKKIEIIRRDVGGPAP